jgi:hypothetical protein
VNLSSDRLLLLLMMMMMGVAENASIEGHTVRKDVKKFYSIFYELETCRMQVVVD